MTEVKGSSVLRKIPSVEKVLSGKSVTYLREFYSEETIKRIVRKTLESLRAGVISGELSEHDCSEDRLDQRVRVQAEKLYGPKLRTVINATGVIVHTNLGRSPLPQSVVDRIAEVAMSYSNLEYDIAMGKRGERNSHLRVLIEELTGAEAALAVNNNAAAVLLALSTMATGKEVIVSRGELIEIGGSFRIPEVMSRSGAILREVGATNRTHVRDYRNAINENTALILKCHTSNYKIVGFTKEVELDELVEIGRDHNIPTMMDLGSGCLVDLRPYGLTDEITVQSVVSSGIDIISFSGDKLLGGPQAGLLVGKRNFIEAMRSNPLARALRMDKMTLAGLEATLEQYTRLEGPFNTIPTLEMISRSPERLNSDAESLARSVQNLLDSSFQISIEPGIGRVGGGALPMSDLEGPRVVIRHPSFSAARFERNLRMGNPPVIALVHENAVLFDCRTLLSGQKETLPALIKKATEL
ncbi:MAG: L-seryl-tRNA(Sec) selenium transferase [Desulfomonilaceae bacterium]